MAENQPEEIYRNGRIRALENASSRAAIVSDGGLTLIEANNQTTIQLQDVSRVECADILPDGSVWIGTEGPHIYRYAGGTVSKADAFDKFDGRDDFYTPWGGPASVRSFAHTANGQVYADIHVCSIIRSADSGQSWEAVTPDLHEDVHQVVTHSGEPDAVYANTADAVFVSPDRGASWHHRADGQPYRYGRAIAIHPEDPDAMIVSVSRGPHGDADGRLYRTPDRGRSWSHIVSGFPESTTTNIDTFQVAFTPDGRTWASVERSLYVSEDKGEHWSTQTQFSDPIKKIAVPQD